MALFEVTQYGFKWGPLEIERAIADDKLGYVLTVRTRTETLDVVTSPKGRKLAVQGPYKRLPPNDSARK